MIAMRRMKVLGWGLEAGWRVRVIRPEQRDSLTEQTAAQQAASQVASIRDADRRRSDWQRMWFEQGSKS